MISFLKLALLILSFIAISADVYSDNELCKLKEPGLDQTNPQSLTTSLISMSQVLFKQAQSLMPFLDNLC